MSSESTQVKPGTAADGDDTGDPAVRIRDLHKTYGSGGDAVTAVDGVSLDVERGSVVGLLGPNGAGKTTTIKSILGLVLPTSGEVTVNGIDVHQNPRAAYNHVGAMLEGARNVYWRLTARENVEFFAALGGRKPEEVRQRYEGLLDQFGLAEKADETVNDLSRGMKQKVSLACTLARGTDVVFLDEPTLGLDVESSVELRRELRRLADQESITVILSSHDMDVVEDLCERVVIMNDGRIVADESVAELMELFRTRAYGVTVEDPVPESARECLQDEFGVDAFESIGDRERFEVVLGDGDDLYRVFDVLRETDCSLDGVDALDPDLEDVFLEITNDADPDQPSGRAPVTEEVSR